MYKLITDNIIQLRIIYASYKNIICVRLYIFKIQCCNTTNTQSYSIVQTVNNYTLILWITNFYFSWIFINLLNSINNTNSNSYCCPYQYFSSMLSDTD